MKKTIAILSLLGLAACGGGGGTGVVSTDNTYTPPAEIIADLTPIDAGTPLSVLANDHARSPISGLASDFFNHVQEAHNDGLTGEGTSIYGSDGTEAAEAIAPGANVFETLPRAIQRSINNNDSFVGGVTIKNDTRNQEYVVFSGEHGEYEAGGAALIWDKFDSVTGSQLEFRINDTRNSDGSMNLREALSPAELCNKC